MPISYLTFLENNQANIYANNYANLVPVLFHCQLTCFWLIGYTEKGFHLIWYQWNLRQKRKKSSFYIHWFLKIEEFFSKCWHFLQNQDRRMRFLQPARKFQTVYRPHVVYWKILFLSHLMIENVWRVFIFEDSNVP